MQKHLNYILTIDLAIYTNKNDYYFCQNMIQFPFRQKNNSLNARIKKANKGVQKICNSTKKIILLLLPFLLMINTGAAFQYDVIRTTEEPGFFMVRIYPDSTLPAFNIESIYVKNYPYKHRGKYTEVIQTIEELGSRIITPEELASLDMTNKRVFILGDAISDFEALNLHGTNRPVESFETFMSKHISPVIIKNLQADFGGNTREIFSDETNFVTNEPVTFVGKFEKARKTRLQVTAETKYGPVELTTPLDLNQVESTNDPIAALLPEIWQSYQPIPEPTVQPKTFWQKWWMSFLPTFLIGISLICFYVVIRWVWLASQKEDEQKEVFLSSTPPSIMKAPDFPDYGLPFEIEFKKKIPK